VFFLAKGDKGKGRGVYLRRYSSNYRFLMSSRKKKTFGF
jgi:hypothetical protein